MAERTQTGRPVRRFRTQAVIERRLADPPATDRSRPAGDIDGGGRTALPDRMATTFLNLIDAVQQGSMSVGEFASAVEQEWNFGGERATLSEAEKAPIQRLFDVVVYYSPLPDERDRIPIYRSEREVLVAAQRCRLSLEADAR